MSQSRPLFPFSAIVAQDEMKLALILNAINPLIGGVLVSGTRGTAKSTAVRALAEVLPKPTPFVNLPVGATEDRVLGTLDIEKALQHGERRFEPGLLAQAHNGILYVDEVNLLPDHLVDVILDAAAMGVNRIEREGISYEHAANIILIGTMNPEEGELRPQLLDRFGLCATVESLDNSDLRKEAMRRRLLFDADPSGFCASLDGDQQALRQNIERARGILGRVTVDEDLLDAIVAKAADAGADGLRADLSLHRAVRALASWQGRLQATLEDLELVSELALSHRRRRRKDQPQPPQTMPPRGRPQSSPPQNAGASGSSSQARTDTVLGFGNAQKASWRDSLQSRAPAPKTARSSGPGKGLHVASRGRSRATHVPTGSVAFLETLRSAALRRPGGTVLPLRRSECVWRRRLQKRRRLVVFVVDASGSMAAMARMQTAKSAALALLGKAYQTRCLVGLIAFRNQSAQILLHPTRSVFLAFRQLRELPAGGATPLAEGLRVASEVVQRALEKDAALVPMLVIITDGRATHPATDAFQGVEREANAINERKWSALCIDTESGIVRIGYTRKLAVALGADYVHSENLPRSEWAPIVEEWLSLQ